MHSGGKIVAQPQTTSTLSTPGGIIYTVGNAYFSGFVQVNPDGSNAINLTDFGYGQLFYPSVSPQTGTVAFQAAGIYGFDGATWSNRIFLMNSDGTGVKELTFPAAPNPSNAIYSQDYKPRISPDGTKIAFISDRNSGQTHQCNVNKDFEGNPGTTKTGSEVWVVNVDGSNLHQVTNTHT